jgi:hypothetical protein
MADAFYTHQIMMKAVTVLALSTESLQGRILDAYLQQVHVLKAEDFPENLWEKFSEVQRVAAAIQSDNSTTSDEAERIINTIFDLYEASAEGWYGESS